MSSLHIAITGGTFALYSLISRYSKIRLIPNQQAEDSMVSNYSIESPSLSLKRAQWLKEKLESSKAAKIGLFTITILGTSMVMGDGTLTPAISGSKSSRESSVGHIVIAFRNTNAFLFTCFCSALCSERDQRESAKFN